MVKLGVVRPSPLVELTKKMALPWKTLIVKLMIVALMALYPGWNINNNLL